VPKAVRAGVLPAVVLWAAATAAQVPGDREFRVNTSTGGFQFFPSVALAGGGDFVVVWASYDGVSEVRGRRYGSGGTSPGPEFRVNTASGSNRFPTVLADPAGWWLVAFMHDHLPQKGQFPWGQRYDPSGSPVGANFKLDDMGGVTQSSAANAAGDAVVVWLGFDADSFGVMGRRFDSMGNARGTSFQVNTFTTQIQQSAEVAMDADGSFVVAWRSRPQDSGGTGIFAQRFDGSGARLGVEFQVNVFTTGEQVLPSLAVMRSGPAAGSFLVAWEDAGRAGVYARRYAADGAAVGDEFHVAAGARPSVAADGRGRYVVVYDAAPDVRGRRYDAAGAPLGEEFHVGAGPSHYGPEVDADDAGRVIVTWSAPGDDGLDVFARTFGGMLPESLAVDPTPTGTSNGNGILERCETVSLVPAWRNESGGAATFDGLLTGFTGNGPLAYAIADGSASYGTVADGAAADCGTACYQVSVSCFPLAVAPIHRDAVATEVLQPATFGGNRSWTIHVGGTFTDVRSGPALPFVEALVHHQLVTGCAPARYCPDRPVTFEELRAVLTRAHGRRAMDEGDGPKTRPEDAVTRQEMAMVALRARHPSLDPPACATPVFDDVPASSPYCRWIEELFRRGVSGGCGARRFCPGAAVTREQMAVFVAATFGLRLSPVIEVR
jgi:hypothetical protein